MTGTSVLGTRMPLLREVTLSHLAFSIPCDPMPQARPRVGIVHGHAMAFKSNTQRANERMLETLLAAYAPKKPLAGPVVLDFLAMLPVPHSDSKRVRKAKLDGFLWPVIVPDLDNLAKMLKDSMTRMRFWKDDRQVVRMLCEKRYGEPGRWEVQIREITMEEVHE